jgi:hypothetical protein
MHTTKEPPTKKPKNDPFSVYHFSIHDPQAKVSLTDHISLVKTTPKKTDKLIKKVGCHPSMISKFSLASQPVKEKKAPQQTPAPISTQNPQRIVIKHPPSNQWFSGSEHLSQVNATAPPLSSNHAYLTNYPINQPSVANKVSPTQHASDSQTSIQTSPQQQIAQSHKQNSTQKFFKPPTPDESPLPLNPDAYVNKNCGENKITEEVFQSFFNKF